MASRIGFAFLTMAGVGCNAAPPGALEPQISSSPAACRPVADVDFVHGTHRERAVELGDEPLAQRFGLPYACIDGEWHWLPPVDDCAAANANPDGGACSTFDAAQRRIIFDVNARLRQERWYSPEGRLVRERMSDPTEPTKPPTTEVTLTYNNLGRLIRREDLSREWASGGRSVDGVPFGWLHELRYDGDSRLIAVDVAWIQDWDNMISEDSEHWELGYNAGRLQSEANEHKLEITYEYSDQVVRAMSRRLDARGESQRVGQFDLSGVSIPIAPPAPRRQPLQSATAIFASPSVHPWNDLMRDALARLPQ